MERTPESARRELDRIFGEFLGEDADTPEVQGAKEEVLALLGELLEAEREEERLRRQAGLS
jgi:hypothetical protein